MIETLTGLFSGVFLGMTIAVIAKGISKEFNFGAGAQIAVVGGILGLIAVWSGVTFTTVQDWLLTVIIIALVGYGVRAVWGKLSGRVKIDGARLFLWTFNVGTAVYIVLFLVALFLWFLPLIGTEFVYYDLNKEGELVLRWFAESVSQIERDAIAAYIIFCFPLMAVFSYYALAGAETREKRNV